jgi:hypothetical protein
MIYLAAPYTGDKETIEQRMVLVCKTIAKMQAAGQHVVSPLLMHFILKHAPLPSDWNFWKTYSVELLQRCDELYVLCLDGWKESPGVMEEIELARTFQKPVTYLPANFENINLVHQKCIRCNQEWSSLEDEHLRDNMTLWCCNDHDTILYYQYKDGKASFDMEVNELHGNDYDVRWNCNCMEEKCFGKNVIYQVYDYDSNIANDIIRYCTLEEMPYNISREDLYKLIQGSE